VYSCFDRHVQVLYGGYAKINLGAVHGIGGMHFIPCGNASAALCFEQPKQNCETGILSKVFSDFRRKVQ